MAPNSRALTVRFASDTGAAKQGVVSLATTIASNMVTIANAGANAGRGAMLASTALNTLFSVASRLRGLGLPMLAGWVAGFSLVKSAVAGVQAELQEMQRIGEIAGRTGVSAEFVQAFQEISRVAQLTARDIEAALGSAFEATKEKWGQASSIFKKLIEVDSFIGRSVSSELFAAGSQDERIRVVLQAMRDLETAGLRLAAIDLAEAMFGAKFADQIRLGKASIEEMARTVETRLASPDLISGEAIRRAEELDRRLKDAWETTDRNLKPAWEGLIGVLLSIKSVWVEIIELVARASAVAQVFGRSAERARLSAEREDISGRLDRNEGAFGLPMTEAGRRQSNRRLRDIDRQLAASGDYFSEFTGAPAYPALPPSFPGGVPMPRAVPRDDGKGGGGRASLDQIESFISAMERSNEVLKAELETLGLGNIEREKAIALAKVAAGERAAGRQLTEEERQKVLELAEAHGVLKQKLEAVRDVQKEIREFGSALGDAFKSAVLEGQKLDQVIASLGKRLAGRAIDNFFDGLFKNLSNNGGFLSFLGLGGTGASVPKMAGGGVIPPGGLAYVGEHGPNPRMIRAGRESITVTPHGLNAGGRVTVHFNVTAPDAPSFMRAEAQVSAMLARAVQRGQRGL